MAATARSNRSGRAGKRARPRIGLALAGGGPEGAVYEIGALLALEEALEDVALDDLHVYVGVSAGAFLVSCLANGLTPREIRRAMVSFGAGGPTPFKPEIFFRPAVKELGSRVKALPRLLYEAVADYVRNPKDLTLLESLTRTTQGLPVGLFDGEPIRAYLERLFSRQGRTDDFRLLGKRLVIVAADLDSGEAVRFGEPGMDHVPISRAVQASAALPGLYPPVEIDGRSYVDGVLLKTLHASVALDAGAELVICINPLVPVDTAQAVEQGVMRRGRLTDRGLPAVLSQAVRTLIRSRLQAGLSAYGKRYQGADVVLLEPRSDDYRMFFTNIFSFSERRAVFEHAYHSTRRFLHEHRAELEPVFERHGLTVRWDVLEDPTRSPWQDSDAPPETRRPPRPSPPRRASRTPRTPRMRSSPAPVASEAAPASSDLGTRLGSALDRLEQVLAERA
jgi:NTE family protein